MRTRQLQSSATRYAVRLSGSRLHRAHTNSGSVVAGFIVHFMLLLPTPFIDVIWQQVH